MLGVEQAGRVGRTPFAQAQGADGVTASFQFGHGHPALGEHVVLAGERAVEHAAGVREKGDVRPDQPGQPFDLFHVRRFNPAGNDVDLAVFLARGLGQIGHGLDHVGEAGHVRADVAGGRGADQGLALRYVALFPGLVKDLVEIVANGLRQTGGMHGDHLRVVDGENVVDRLQQVGLTAEHRSAFGERTGGRGNRLLVMPGQSAAVVGAAALGPMAVGETALDAQRCVHGADGLAGLGRIDGDGAALVYFLGCMSK